VEFQIRPEAQMVLDQVERFIDEKIIPNEATFIEQAKTTPDGEDTPLMKALRAEAKELGLWNLFLPDSDWGAGLTNNEYAAMCEYTGRSAPASRVFNCNAPDTGNMEILLEFGTDE